jgi:hypothetical protein
MKAGFVVYWLDVSGIGDHIPNYRHFEMHEMSEALGFTETLRKTGMWYVGMVSQNSNSVGKAGVDDKLPEDYSWSKQHRGDGEPAGPKSLIGGRSNG